MASKTLTDLVRELQVDNTVFREKVGALEKTADANADLRERPARAEAVIEELTKTRDVSGTRLFQIGVAILTAQFGLIITVIGALVTAVLRK